ncbi:putative membrane protein YeaQ/YmgE (transglycosylase-associated protein family) [Aliiruegeria haliotis]|uniref:Putative membrane protein YeaQ/YmgE (Transglycosylase-associated protein family) n=1 Tax=Aliiruegeria haliotis TaxID=1280846 RepID=A0A2T0RKX4_9RHOB|nr:GlsB/YeaQ/YmgE family stress response membrane protein [Aliiruegeria haliotis]PRY21787.1 putative membrane protein YeaQ/YmgE (transglycosylase-associated protein family) [Aliiruegeria haliotis]
MDQVTQAETMVFSGFFIAIIIGALAGWLAGKLVAGGGFGFLGNTILGIGGALLANWLLPQIGLDFGSGFFGSVLSAAIGAAIVLVAIRIIKRI